MRRELIILVGLTLSATSCSAQAVRSGLPSDFYRTDAHLVETNTSVSYYIDNGSAFGLNVGMDRKVSQSIMSKRMGLFDSNCDLPSKYRLNDGIIHNDDQVLVNCVSQSWTDIYDVRGVNATGWVRVKSHAGKVYRIEWDAGEGYPG
jgi:hypothetical protein